ncbi:hypothetical protein HB837_15860 [Listeria innocua]|uniref:phage head-tail connector protein n=1 Tax=Listeria innocua TaxID=1642 RepID=UPI001626AE64|nr:hypothetical protein [Listeria innocua]MBC1353882.1 hypothetical protein [Listeria innocua]
MTILQEIKTLLEIDDISSDGVSENIFDEQLIKYINSGIRYLINNSVPITPINDSSDSGEWEKVADHYEIIRDYLHLHVLQRFDRTLVIGGVNNTSNTTMNWIESEKTDLLYQLKCFFDLGDTNEV